MRVEDTQNTNGWQFQRRLFIDSLYKEMDKAAASAQLRNGRLTQAANEYVLEDGLQEDVAVDLLIIDGYDPEQARQCVHALTPDTMTAADSSVVTPPSSIMSLKIIGRRLFSGRELDNIIEASTKEEAEISITETLASFDPPVRLVSVEKLD